MTGITVDTAPLYRQRRFLILMSLAVMAYYALGATVKDSAEYSGFGVTLRRPERVALGLWIVWSWSLWRYWIRFYELTSALWGEVKADVEKEENRLARKWAKGRIGERAKLGQLNNGDRIIRKVMTVYWDFPQDESGQPAASHITDSEEGGREYTVRFEFLWSQEDDAKNRLRADMPIVLQMSKGMIGWLRVRAWIYAVFSLPAFSEHVLPFALAATTPVVSYFCFNEESLVWV